MWISLPDPGEVLHPCRRDATTVPDLSFAKVDLDPGVGHTILQPLGGLSVTLSGSGVEITMSVQECHHLLSVSPTSLVSGQGPGAVPMPGNSPDSESPDRHQSWFSLGFMCLCCTRCLQTTVQPRCCESLHSLLDPSINFLRNIRTFVKHVTFVTMQHSDSPTNNNGLHTGA